jgi:hypothetical protein
METKFNFKSAICTSRSQSERLLALGLKKETADMCHFWHWESDDYIRLCASWEFAHRSNKDIPAWSLHRLLSLYNLHYIEFMNDEEIESVYDIVINAIEQAIKEGIFNKEYLV